MVIGWVPVHLREPEFLRGDSFDIAVGGDQRERLRNVRATVGLTQRGVASCEEEACMPEPSRALEGSCPSTSWLPLLDLVMFGG